MAKWWWWLMLAPRGQRQADVSEYRVSIQSEFQDKSRLNRKKSQKQKKQNTIQIKKSASMLT